MGIPIRLLLIEDSVIDAKLVIHELEQSGYDPIYERIENEAAMLSALDSDSWDVIIADYRLPEFSGPEALAVLKHSAIDLPFIIVSGAVGEATAVEAMKAGAHDYVMKDNLTRLPSAISRELEEANVRREGARAEAAHRESEQRFRTMADSAPVVIWMTDEYFQCTYFNVPGLRFHDKMIEDMLGDGWMNTLHPDDRDAFQNTYIIASGKRAAFENELRSLRCDGEWRWMLGTATPRLRSDGSFAGYIGTFVDFTERKRAETERETTLMENGRLLIEKAASVIKQRTFLKEILLSVTEGKLRLCDAKSDLPGLLGPIAGSIALSAASLSEARRMARDLAEAIGLSADRRYDLITAVGEAGMNAVVHAGGGAARLYADSDKVQIWIEDKGSGIDMDNLPRATLERGYTTANSLGHGFFMMLASTDAVYLLTGAQGTTIVLEQNRVAPEPAWIRELTNIEHDTPELAMAA